MAVERVARWVFTDPLPPGRHLTVERENGRWLISMECRSVDFPVELRLEPGDDEYLAMLLLGEDEEWLARYRAGEFKRSNNVRLGVEPGYVTSVAPINLGDGFYNSDEGTDWVVSYLRANGLAELTHADGEDTVFTTVQYRDLRKPPWRHTPKAG